MVLPGVPTTYVPSFPYPNQRLMFRWSAYTSLLRITTTLPPKEETEAKADDAQEATPQTNESNNTSPMSRLTAMVTRPLFTRGASRSGTGITPSELERGNGASN